MVTIKSPEHIESMRIAGRILARTLDLVEKAARPGVSTAELDRLAYDFIVKENKAIPSFLNYDGYPATLCTSIDDEIVHGIPSENRILKEGQLLKIDCGVGWKGYHTDAARTVPIGKVSEEKLRLAQVCKESFFEGVKVLKNGERLGTLGEAIQTYAEARGYGVVRALIGHGIGESVHEEPDVPNYGKAGRGMRVFTGMTLAIEPMINLGTYHIRQGDDGWTISTADGLCSAHYENTVVITDDGVEILTLLQEDGNGKIC